VPRVYLFSDEVGDFTFRRGSGASLYSMIATVKTIGCASCDPFPDTAVLDGLVVAEEPGERIER
jgi:hypothetical protein